MGEYCGEGVAVTYVEDYLSEHISYAATGAPAAVGLLAARFAGLPASDNC